MKAQRRRPLNDTPHVRYNSDINAVHTAVQRRDIFTTHVVFIKPLRQLNNVLESKIMTQTNSHVYEDL